MRANGRFIGGRRRKKVLQIDTMTCAVTGEEGMEAGREAERRKANTANGGEIGSISTPKWDNHHSLLFLKTSYIPCVHFFRIQGLNLPRLTLMYQKSCYQITATNTAEDSQTRTCYTSSKVNVFSLL